MILQISTLFNARKEKSRLEYEVNGEDWMIDWIVGDTIWIILLLATGFILNDIIYIMVTS